MRKKNDLDEPPEEDVAYTIARLNGQWVSPKNFRNPEKNSWRSHVTEQLPTKKTMEKYREEGNYVLSTKTITEGRDAGGILGQDKGGAYFKRTGKNRRAYRYEYFLEDKYNKTLSSEQK